VAGRQRLQENLAAGAGGLGKTEGGTRMIQGVRRNKGQRQMEEQRVLLKWSSVWSSRVLSKRPM
jgi:hypothetical protein